MQPAIQSRVLIAFETETWRSVVVWSICIIFSMHEMVLEYLCHFDSWSWDIEVLFVVVREHMFA